MLFVIHKILNKDIKNIARDVKADNSAIIGDHLNAIANSQFRKEFIDNIASHLSNDQLFELTKAMMILFNKSDQATLTNMIRQDSLAGSLYKELAKRTGYQPPAQNVQFDELNALVLENVKKMPVMCNALGNDNQKIEVAATGCIFARHSLIGFR